MRHFLVGSIARSGAALLRIRWAVRAPIVLYRARLGAVFGDRLLMLEHTGRTTGRRRRVVLEVVEHPAPGQWIVVSGFGEQAQWLRNVAAHPDVRLYLGSHPPRQATALRLQPDSAAACLIRYRTAHPRAWARLSPVLERTLGHRIDAEGVGLPVVILTAVPTPRGSARGPNDRPGRRDGARGHGLAPGDDPAATTTSGA